LPSRDKMPKGKVQLNVLIDEETYRELVKLAPSIYNGGRYRGAISRIVEEALRYYLGLLRSAQAHTNPKLSIRDVFARVVMRLRDRYGFTPKEIPEYELDQAIAETRGSDKRTIEKWKRVFEDSGLIKYIGGFKPRRIVELIGAMACP